MDYAEAWLSAGGSGGRGTITHVTPTRFIALPPRHVAASRLAWRIARAVVAREQGWFLESLHVSRRWQVKVDRSRWIVLAFVSFFFDESNPRGPGAPFAIYLEPKGTVSTSDTNTLFRELGSRLGYGTHDGKCLVRTIRDTSPRVLLAEMDRIAQTFDTDDRHRVPRSRSRAPRKRLTAIADEVLVHGTWTFETPTLWHRPDVTTSAALSPTPSGIRDRPALSSMLYIANREASDGASAAIARAEARGYDERAGAGQPDAALMKVQPLSLRAALREAQFLGVEVAERHAASGDGGRP